MRKIISLIAAAGLIAGLALMPSVAQAKKKKTIEESFTAQAVPYPVTATANGDGCLSSVEGVHKVSHTFTTPKPGVLEASMHTFDGDWDLHVTDADGNVLGSSTSGQPVAAPGEQVIVAVAGKTDVVIVACNWLGGPSATVDYVFTY